MTQKEYNRCAAGLADDIMRFAASCCSSREDCEDAVQKAFAVLWQRRGSVEVHKAKSFLFSTVYRQLLQTFRHQRTVQRHAPYLTGSYAVEPDTDFDLRSAIAMAMDTLPGVQRAILHLRDVEGYSYREIGENLGLDDDRVQVYLFRARVAMRRQLKSMGYDNNR